ncbi:chemotaxis protein CheA [Clostridium tepidiprofundi DSM 19306]|uniref:Chemotaxis protein CheA n=1 Tax=Clostridium tepidiprofundi DSM 19306 TaxID=1121338 RepID=A0A151B4F5_9CLOT|nr:chemotaxis protein CheA [Clostridium tepidiprofundi]KYH34788.1 chemotaxis protein CheA [Clostridium tepidiprofundi DSM 19306]
MDTSQYLSMFLEESMDNLQTLNDSLLQLEQEPNDIDKLNEIFRVAHTIKGMAATMGFNEMAELTHKMEDVLSEFREGKLQVTQKVVTVLFKCLDTLELMVNNISEGIDEAVPVEDIISELHSIAEEDELTVENASDDVQDSKSDMSDHKNEDIEKFKQRMDLDEYDLSVIKQAADKNINSFEIKIVLSENTLLKSARVFLIFKSLEEYGEIIKSVPCAEDLENENFDRDINLVYLSNASYEEVNNILNNISEIDEIVVDKIDIGSKNVITEVNETQQSNNSSSVPKATQKDRPQKSGNKSAKKTKEIQKNRKKVHQSVRVDLERLDKFLTMVSELVIHRTRLEQITDNLRITELNETLEQVARTTLDLQDLVMKIRMLPLEVVFNRFPRMIRDLSVELDKDMELIIEGQETELDRTVIDEIGEPLIHLLRNAADHGIESREERIAKGKDPVGKIRLIAYPEGTKAVIKVEDDGGGINIEKVKSKAEEKGINTEGMTDNDIRNLIFDQGFSTNTEVTDISGRGVGMDVVKTKIAALGGTVDVVSEEGKGTSFIIKLPLTLQIIQALLVKIGKETMAISLGYIDRVIDYKEDIIKKTNNREIIIYNENVIPLIRVNEKLQIEPDENSRNYIVIVRIGEKTVGLLVDSLLGQQEIVIKPLGKTLKGLKEYIGATILGDGLVTLILDVAALI